MLKILCHREATGNNSATWRRSTSQATWKKAAGIGVGFNIEVQE
jgi:hypothetical protein